MLRSLRLKIQVVTFQSALNLSFRPTFLLVLFCLIAELSAATFTVTSNADSGAGSLRQAVANAKTQNVGGTILFAPALSGTTIRLSSPILINDVFGNAIDLTIDATSLPAGLTISGGNTTVIFQNGDGTKTVTLCGLSLVDGNAGDSAGGAIGNSGSLTLIQCSFLRNSARYAGAINHAGGTLTMIDCTLSANTAQNGESGAIYVINSASVRLERCTFAQNKAKGSSGYAGAIFVANVFDTDTVTMIRCSFTENSAEQSGGAIYNDHAAIGISDSTFSRNKATTSGGAILNDETISISRSTFSENSTSAGYGGGVYNASSVPATISQSTFNGNFTGSSGGGGALYGGGKPSLIHCTISGNSAGSAGGGGIYGGGILTNCIIAGNTSSIGADIKESGFGLSRAGSNLIGNNDSSAGKFPAGLPNANGDFVGSAASLLPPQLAALGNNGGTTQTMALLAGSLARNRGNVISPLLATDQRERPIIGAPDIGAFENQFGATIRPLVIPSSAASGSVICNLDTEGTVTLTSSNPALIPVSGAVFTGSGLTRILTITPSPGLVGSSTLVLTHEPSGETDTFQVYVLPAGYIPASVSNIVDQTINEDSGPLTVPFTVTDASSVLGLTVSVTSSNGALIPNSNISVSGAGQARSLVLTPASNANGTATITVTVSDGATTAVDSFSLTVVPVNDAPAFVKGPDIKTYSGNPSTRDESWVQSMSPGPPDETSQTLRFIVTNDNNALFAIPPVIDRDGRLIYTPTIEAAGTAIITVVLEDNGGTALGGLNQSTQTFSLTLISSSTPTVVTNIGDDGPGSLRDMVSTAAARPGADVITFSPGIAGQTITLSTPIAINFGNSPLAIDATQLPNGITISGNHQTRVFQNSTGFTLRGLRIVGGNGNSDLDNRLGGAIYNTGTLSMSDCVLFDNIVANGRGGAIYSTGAITMARCTLSGNGVNSGDGGAIFSSSGLTNPITLTRCTFSGNFASNGAGGAIHTSATSGLVVAVTQCTLSGNAALGAGGAIYHFGGSLRLTHSTFAGNTANLGGGIYNTSGSFFISNSIVATNTANTGPEIYISSGTATRSGVNLIGNNSTITLLFPAGAPHSNGSFAGTSSAPLNPRLASLGNYGGPTQTMALLSDSVARNRAPAVSPPITVDQRGFPIVGTPDVGAYEAGTTNTFSLWSIESALPAPNFKGDSDIDGVPDGVEYATRSNPIAGSTNPLTTLLNTSEGMRLSFPYRVGATDICYVVRRSSDLRIWAEIYRYDTRSGIITETGVTSVKDSVAQTITVIDPSKGDKYFWRLEVEELP